MKIKNIISNLLIIFIILIILNICYSKIILKEDLIKIFGKSFLIITSGSMEPEISSGELIVISKEKQYLKDDIVTYIDKDNSFVTHRIVNINENDFISKGDFNDVVDDLNSNLNIKGKVIYHSKIWGFFVLYILKPLVIIYIILFCFINICYWQKNKVKYEKQNKVEKDLKINENIKENCKDEEIEANDKK